MGRSFQSFQLFDHLLGSGGTAALALVLAMTLLSPPAAAAPVVTITDISIAGNAGFFDVHLTNPGGTDQIGGYTVSYRVTPEIGATGDPTFTSITQAPSPTFNDANQVPIFGHGNTDYYTVNDIYNTNPPGYVTGGDNTNLFRANFTVPNGTSGRFDVTLLTGAAGNVPGSELDNGTGKAIAGTTFSPTPAILITPEPASAGVVALGTLLLLRRRRQVNGHRRGPGADPQGGNLRHGGGPS